MKDPQAKDFLPIRVSTLRGDLKIPFDAYVHVAGKYIIYCRKGDSFEGNRLNRLREKKLKKLHIESSQEESYRQYIKSSIDMAYDSKSQTPLATRTEIVQGQQVAAAEQVIENPQDEKAYKESKKASAQFAEFLKNEPLASKMIFGIENTDLSVAHHGVNVATFAIGMVSHLNFDNQVCPSDILALGCFLHDLEHLYTPVKFYLEDSKLSSQEQFLYRQHPKKGAERVTSLKHFDPGVIQIILEHEELISGEGFPRGLKEIDMNPMTLIASTANAFDRYLSFQKLGAKEALKTMLLERIGLHPLDYVKALQEFLKSSKLI